VRHLLPLLVLPLLSCATPEEPDRPWSFEGCDALDGTRCSLPFPSSYHLRPDEGTATGWRLALREEHLPLAVDGSALDPTRWNRLDGFSIGSPILAGLGPLDLEGVARQDSIERSLEDDSPTLLLDLTTGERVPHWVEVDAHATDPGERLTILWPARVLDFDRDYLVVFRQLRTESGEAIELTEAMRALRDGVETEDPDIENRRARYDNVLWPALEAQGVDRGEVRLAWDFHTASRAGMLGDAESMVEDALARARADGIDYAITDQEVADCTVPETTTWKIVRGTFTVPSYTEEPVPGHLLARDEAGRPTAVGTRDARFLVRIPCSVQRDPGPTFLIQYGHGLLGTEGEAETGWLGRFLDDQRMMVIAAQQTGMASEDYANIALLLANDLSRFATMTDRLHQGLVEQVLLMELALGPLAEDPALQVDGTRLIDPDDADLRGWYGISQGGIIGGAYVGISPHVDRGVLSVGGGPYPLLLPRSANFEGFFDILRRRYDSELDQMFLIHGLLGHLWDATESTGWSHDLRDKRILSQIALGDAQVHVQGSRFQARSIDATLLTPSVSPVFGLSESGGPVEGSAYVEVDYGLTWPDVNLPPDTATDPHECPRRDPDLQAQVVRFLRDGVAEHTCDGPCVRTFDGGCP
jgi:hypothetical protein